MSELSALSQEIDYSFFKYRTGCNNDPGIDGRTNCRIERSIHVVWYVRMLILYECILSCDRFPNGLIRKQGLWRKHYQQDYCCSAIIRCSSHFSMSKTDGRRIRGNDTWG